MSSADFRGAPACHLFTAVAMADNDAPRDNPKLNPQSASREHPYLTSPPPSCGLAFDRDDNDAQGKRRRHLLVLLTVVKPIHDSMLMKYIQVAWFRLITRRLKSTTGRMSSTFLLSNIGLKTPVCIAGCRKSRELGANFSHRTIKSGSFVGFALLMLFGQRRANMIKLPYLEYVRRKICCTNITRSNSNVL